MHFRLYLTYTGNDSRIVTGLMLFELKKRTINGNTSIIKDWLSIASHRFRGKSNGEIIIFPCSNIFYLKAH